MKILLVSDNFFPETNAAAYRVYERACFWVKEGHEVTVLTSCPNFPDGIAFQGYKNHWRFVEEIQGIRVVRVKTFMSANQGFLRRLFDFLSFMISSFFFSFFEGKFDIVVATSPQFFTTISGYLISVFKRIPFAVEIADLWPESVKAVGVMKESYFLNLMEKVELFIYRKADVIITLTDSINKNIGRRGISTKKIKTIMNGVNLDFFEPIFSKNSVLLEKLNLENKFVVGYIGTLGMAHNLGNVLDAAEYLKKIENSKVHFLIVGAGAEKNILQERVLANDLQNVTLVDRQSKEEIKKYWSLCDVALVHLKNISTFSTVIPSKIFEAMAIGRPILYCGPKSDGSDIVTKEVVGMQIESDDSIELAKTILQLESNIKQQQEFTSNCYGAVKNYTRQNQAKKFTETLDEYLNV